MSEAMLCLGCMKTNDLGEPCPYCGFNEKAHLERLGKKAAMYLALGSTLAQNQFIVGRVIGQGNFGITYIGLDTKSHRRVAIKEYMPRSLAYRSLENQQLVPFNEDNRLSFSYGLQQFLKESGILAGLKELPGIARVYTVFQQNGTAYMVMEYLEGRTLETHSQHSLEPMDWDEALDFVLPLLEVLVAIHGAGLIHRDICPDNIFFCIDGSVKLIDFGGARQALIDQNKNLSVVLKPGYAPLENYISKGKRGPWTDIYSLAATIFRIVTGTRIPEASVRIENDTLARRIGEAAAIPERVRPVILKALALRVEERYSNVADFRRDLLIASGYRPEEIPGAFDDTDAGTAEAVQLQSPPSPIAPLPQAQPQAASQAPPSPAPEPAAGRDKHTVPAGADRGPVPLEVGGSNMRVVMNESRTGVIILIVILSIIALGFGIYILWGDMLLKMLK